MTELGTAREAAEWCLARGWVPVPIPPGRKGPNRPKWEQLTADGYNLDELFPRGGRSNVGVLTGFPSGGLVDVDLDCPEAVDAAGLLPGTGLLWGRAGVPTHRAFVVWPDPPAKKSREWDDPVMGRIRGARILELRSTGGQTVIPPSVYPADDGHPRPEACAWVRRGEPARVALPDLLAACGKVAAAALVARYWRAGTRHDAGLALAGGLLRAGWSAEDVEAFVDAVCAAAGDDETADRVRAARDTGVKLAAGQPVTGWPTLAKLLGEPGEVVVRAARDWLGAAVAPAGGAAAWAGDGAEARTGVRIVLDYLRDRYRPAFRVGNALSAGDGREVPMAEACSVPDSDLIRELAAATDAPRYAASGGGGVRWDALPGFFAKWAKVAWGDLLKSLPEEEAAELGPDAPAAEAFRQLVREALCTPIVLGDSGGEGGPRQVERRSLIGWCERFARDGVWRDIRSLKVWCKVAEADGEIKFRVALRHELFAQIGADRRLRAMGLARFNQLCARYGVGSTSRDDRPHGRTAVILDQAFTDDLWGYAPAEELGGADDPEGRR